VKHIVSLSSGLSSAVTADRVINKYKDVELVFMDTLIEDEDNYRFMNELLKMWDMPLTILKEGRTPYQVSKDAQIIPNNKIAPCTFKLKIEMFTKYLKDISGDITIHIGYDYSELHRCERTKKSYGEHGWDVDFPLLWKPIEYRTYEQVSKEDWGIEPPRMYKMGYSHANCGGVCVKQGWSDWERTLINFPDKFAEAEEWERKMRIHPIRKDYGLMKDQSGGKTTALTLKEFRERIESKTMNQYDMFSNDSCVHCGIGDI
jgi:hypothetical protein